MGEGRQAPEGYDQVARWQDLEQLFPEAEFRRKSGFFVGRLRPEADKDVHATLKGLIDALVAREAGHPVVYRSKPS